jgi:hypothetical protein
VCVCLRSALVQLLHADALHTEGKALEHIYGDDGDDGDDGDGDRDGDSDDDDDGDSE